MTFGLARSCKWRVIYTDDRVENGPELLTIFYRQSTLHEWMNKHPHYTIRRMTIAYEYPSFNNYDKFQ